MSSTGRLHAALVRGALYFGLWLVLDQSGKPADLGMGLLAAAAAAWASVRLLPPAAGRVRLGRLLARLPRFLWHTLRAGVDVARRAFAPRLALRPGFVEHGSRLPAGPARQAWRVIVSLMPGSVPTGEHAGIVEFHCLDVGQPVAAQLAAEERAYAPILHPGSRDD